MTELERFEVFAGRGVPLVVSGTGPRRGRRARSRAPARRDVRAWAHGARTAPGDLETLWARGRRRHRGRHRGICSTDGASTARPLLAAARPEAACFGDGEGPGFTRDEPPSALGTMPRPAPSMLRFLLRDLSHQIIKKNSPKGMHGVASCSYVI